MRPVTSDDIEAVHRLVVARDVADLGAPDFTMGNLRDEWARAGFDPAADAVVVEDGPALVGVAWMRERQALALVHPDHEGRGHGTALLAWAERRTVELGRPVHRQEVAGDSARELLMGHGYRYVTSFHRMEIDLGSTPPPAPAWPAGVAVRPLDPVADAAALHAISEAAFVAVPSFSPDTLESFRTEHMAAHDLSLELSRVVVAGDRPVGFATVHPWPEESEGYVDLLAVDPGAQTKGIGTALLADVLGASRAAGLERGVLWVDAENPRALALYERTGMRRTAEAARYERPLS